MIKISKDDIEQYRTIGELNSWIKDVFDSIHSDDSKTAIRLKTSPEIKTLIEEIIPINIFSQKYFNGEDISIKPIVGNQSYDAKIKGSELIDYLEVTRAINGYDEILRNEHLDKHGSVPALGKFEVLGTKASGSRKVDFVHECVSHNDTMNNTKQLILEAVNKKICAQEKYNEKIFLIVAFDDSFFHVDVSDTHNVDEFIDKEISSMQHIFCGIAIVGTQRHYFKII